MAGEVRARGERDEWGGRVEGERWAFRQGAGVGDGDGDGGRGGDGLTGKLVGQIRWRGH